MRFEAWVFDVYPVSGGMATWWIPKDGGNRVRLLDAWRPALYVGGTSAELETVRNRLANAGAIMA